MKIARDILIAFQLLSDNMGCLTVHQLSQVMRVSRTQAKQIIEDCIYWLEKRGVVLKDEREKRTVSVPPEGLEQLRELLKNISEKEYYYSFFERRKYIVFKLLTNHFITNYQICEMFEISRNTCIADMTAISRFLKNNGFQLRITSNKKGYMLAGKVGNPKADSLLHISDPHLFIRRRCTFVSYRRRNSLPFIWF